MEMDLHDLIEQVACELYLKSGKVEGRDLDNWLEAERIIAHRLTFAEEYLGDVVSAQSA